MTFGVICTALAFATGVVTELLPVKSEYKPVVPKVLGLISVVVGVSYYHMTYVDSIGIFASALASASVSGLVKHTLGLKSMIDSFLTKFPIFKNKSER